jgi:hypothetical protein
MFVPESLPRSRSWKSAIAVARRSAYEAIFASAAVEFFASVTRSRQRKILDRTHELANDPFLVPDFRSSDAAGREISHFMTDGFIFDFWVDHAVKQVVVTNIDYVE